MTQKKRLRCAIYTRKSTDEGLDQAFNSLDAQREACAAYILSQKSEGWSLLPTRYDDGGFSGGDMNRPALVRLLADVRDRKVDIVIVYKVDRLTRSLNDFARIVDVFDKTGASFVSVTQQFNTTTSMGRLTLNVLLSFAQFEREVIGERIRDKIAQSKAKGMWMGGPVPLGYDAVDRNLVPNAVEAKTVEHIFSRYLAVPSTTILLKELKAAGIVSKPRTMREGAERGGCPFVRGPLHHLLGNPIYIGKVRHRGHIYDGQHPPILDQALWEAVQAKRSAALGDRKGRGSSQHSSLLTGTIRDHVGRPLSPSHAVRNKKRYRYYVSGTASVVDGVEGDTPALRLNARELEEAVLEATAHLLADERAIMALPSVDALALQRRFERAQGLASTLRGGSKTEVRHQLLMVGLAMTVHPDHIDASLSQDKLAAVLDGTTSPQPDEGDRITIPVLATPVRRGRTLKLMIGSQKLPQPRTDLDLIALLRKAEVARQKLFAQADASSQTHREDERIARLAFLAPDIVGAILEGRQPPMLTARRLIRHAGIPLDWKDQREALGF
ncbi:Invertase/recombinase like protein [Sphingomonas paucimobilis]|nr:Invertase/recombinase like protein [Sphingomonas paucimobilis]